MHRISEKYSVSGIILHFFTIRSDIISIRLNFISLNCWFFIIYKCSINKSMHIYKYILLYIAANLNYNFLFLQVFFRRHFPIGKCLLKKSVKIKNCNLNLQISNIRFEKLPSRISMLYSFRISDSIIQFSVILWFDAFLIFYIAKNYNFFFLQLSRLLIIKLGQH